MTKIYCKNGDHWYDRESKRGRPPLNCELHQPPKSNIKIYNQQSNPSRVDHSSGIPTVIPKTLEDRVPGISAVLEQESMRTLICAVGDHEFQSPRRRGRPPRVCPEHASAYFSPSSKKNSTAIPSARTSEVISNLLSLPSARSCRCELSPTSTAAEIRAKEGGCTSPQYVCGTLDSIRRSLNL